MKKITLFLVLCSSLSFAQGYEQAKNLLDRVSKEMKSKKKIRFPKRELNSWLRSHHSWGESEWQELLQELNHTGFGEWVGNPEGRDQVGLYLETHRR